MSYIELCAPCGFALEAVLSREIKELGFDVTRVEDGRVYFLSDEYGIAKANLWLRTADRILVKIGEFYATSFEELFENTKRLPWHEWIPKEGSFPAAKASSVRSKLFSTSDIQSIVKKAVVESLKKKYKINWFSETGPSYPIHILIFKDKVTIYLDTSGVALHKRGYREIGSTAPIRETLAAALVSLTPWKEGRLLVDPFCGSGTILIEAALKGLNIAPGLSRDFVSEKWFRTPEKLWNRARQEAQDSIKPHNDIHIQGYDIDEKVIKIARSNAKKAGVEEYIHFQQRDVRDFSSKEKYGFIVTNPPYGERLEDIKTVEQLYRDMGKVFSTLDTWSFYILTAHDGFERYFGRKADKKRKLYNGMLKTDLYQYFGPKPPKTITVE
ncbi:THUMP domain-containing class I SAM-dependent RNA methyltransferase [Lutispora thermophila]|uniref:Putative N6-adenine-specific DNA methylase n=1 Tax=Lutispora thermophila DSM 19022 TaxID=1122184 RepID=A0A1M6FVR8_9FIRM|nr:class I SAM-dependent RNA methyltransferase [Lutispora thermophila]SHJ01826.1 putative N6-adenine-specific DNA methylase [Lutispora thermophila DSM 19022]